MKKESMANTKLLLRNIPTGQESVACFSQNVLPNYGRGNALPLGALPIGQESIACFTRITERQSMNNSGVDTEHPVLQALQKAGISTTIHTFSSSTRTASDAANSIGCSVGQIVKSLVFRLVSSDTPVLVLISGSDRASEERLAQVLKDKVERANADFVRQQTGYSIGGVPPLGHPEKLRTIVDDNLLQYETVWAAAGTPYSVFSLTTTDLLRATSGELYSVRE